MTGDQVMDIVTALLVIISSIIQYVRSVAQDKATKKVKEVLLEEQSKVKEILLSEQSKVKDTLLSEQLNVKEILVGEQSKSNVKIESLVKTTEVIHKLVNSATSTNLHNLFIALRRVADITKDPEDIKAAKGAFEAYQEHERKQDRVDKAEGSHKT